MNFSTNYTNGISVQIQSDKISFWGEFLVISAFIFTFKLYYSYLTKRKDLCKIQEAFSVPFKKTQETKPIKCKKATKILVLSMALRFISSATNCILFALLLSANDKKDLEGEKKIVGLKFSCFSTFL